MEKLNSIRESYLYIDSRFFNIGKTEIDKINTTDVECNSKHHAKTETTYRGPNNVFQPKIINTTAKRIS